MKTFLEAPETAAAPDGTVSSDVVLSIRHLNVEYVSPRREVQAVQDVNLTVRRGQTVAIVGESGSGKSSVANAIIGVLPDNARLSGDIEVLGRSLDVRERDSWNEVRGGIIGFVPQDPQTNLDPTLTIGVQISEIIRLFSDVGKVEAKAKALKLLSEVGFDNPELRYKQYPHELSGGLKQRVLIAEALASNPKIIVADEPTSALDVTVQKTILDKLDVLVHQRGIALVMITHDLAVASDRAQQIIVMHNGSIVESGDAEQVLHNPKHPYTEDLLAAAPAFRAITGERLSLQPPREGDSHDYRKAGDNDSEYAVQWRGVVKRFHVRNRREPFIALDGVDLAAREGKTLAIVGESGSGKTTLLRLLLALDEPSEGQILLNGEDIGRLNRRELRQRRRDIQLVQQNPFDALDPHFNIRNVVTEPLKAFHVGTKKERDERAAELIQEVALPLNVLAARPRELSGGQCQRVAIARALAIRPKILVFDEPVSALDVSVQSQILDLLTDIQRDLHLTYVFVSHDLAVVSQIADDVAVIEHGHLVEQGPCDEVLSNPKHPYTRRLIEAIPGKGELR